MNNILVLYDSASGNTKKMAEFVAEGIRGSDDVKLRLKSVDEAGKEDISWCDGIAVGTPTNMGIISWKMKKFWDETCNDLWGKIDGKIGCAFSSQGGWGGGAELTCLSILTVLMNYGFLVFGATDYVADGYTLHYGAVAVGEPRDEKARDACRRLGQRLVLWVSKYSEKDSFHLLKEDIEK
ncbi:MAG TPA: flavodoxin domain-containing protein [Ignavibacteriaceae bacterium]|nr:flavodoxin domain-containing protein [Ignavibacteriaceae bacterium]